MELGSGAPQPVVCVSVGPRPEEGWVERVAPVGVFHAGTRCRTLSFGSRFTLLTLGGRMMPGAVGDLLGGALFSLHKGRILCLCCVPPLGPLRSRQARHCAVHWRRVQFVTFWSSLMSASWYAADHAFRRQRILLPCNRRVIGWRRLLLRIPRARSAAHCVGCRRGSTISSSAGPRVPLHLDNGHARSTPSSTEGLAKPLPCVWLA